MEPIRFDGQVVLVTGAGSGLGRVYAHDFARRGAQVIVNDIGVERDGSGKDEGPAREVVSRITALGGTAVANTDDVATPEGGEAMVAAALDAFGRLDVVVHNAGILRDMTLRRLPVEDWNAVRSVHLDGAFHVCKPAFRVMKAQKYGRVIFTSSAAGWFGNYGQSHYAAAKMGVVGFMRSAAIEGGKHHIRCNAIAPLARTRMTEDLLPEEILAHMDPEIVSAMVLLLASSACPCSGELFHVGLGRILRARLMTGAGLVLDPASPPDPESISSRWDAVMDLEEMHSHKDIGDFLTDILEG